MGSGVQCVTIDLMLMSPTSVYPRYFSCSSFSTRLSQCTTYAYTCPSYTSEVAISCCNSSTSKPLIIKNLMSDNCLF